MYWVTWSICRGTDTQKLAKSKAIKFAVPPMPRIMILEPLDESTMKENEKSTIKNNYDEISVVRQQLELNVRSV